MKAVATSGCDSRNGLAAIVPIMACVTMSTSPLYIGSRAMQPEQARARGAAETLHQIFSETASLLREYECSVGLTLIFAILRTEVAGRIARGFE